MPQCTTGTPKSYGAEADFKYENNADWNSRRDSLFVGGRYVIGPAHMLITLRKADFSDAPGGLKYVEAYQLDYWTYSSFAEHLADDMMDRPLLHTLKAEHISKGFKELKDAGKFPSGPLEDWEIGPALRKAFAELPAGTLANATRAGRGGVTIVTRGRARA